MDEFTVQLGCVAGFRLDLQDLGTNFSSNASRMLSAMSVPSGTTGLMATLGSAFERLQGTLSSSHQRDLASLNTFSANLATAGTQYQASDSATTKAISTLAAGETAGVSGALGVVSRFAGLQLPSLSAVEESQFTVRQVVEVGVELVAPYDEKLSAAIGMKPAADYLTPLAADWEALQTLGKRIYQLGINDFVASENLSGGLRWLQGSWSGSAAQAFAASAGNLGQAIAIRSADLDEVSKIVQNGGVYLERLVYNQAVELTSALAQPMSFLDITLPLSGWAQLVNQPMRDTIKTEIVAAVDAMKKSVDARRDAITTGLGTISQALDYSPGRAGPTFNAIEFEIPDKVIVDLGARRYGFGNNIWWESNIASAS
ncbi:hypothetical protein [Nocardia sp. NBC_01009]|uniref:hypothetical protein n=1 Tax=Nocardia sp. NBC_01009 TaxID=2975996 RepID=UPI003866663E|nr:hypothetical protein OHA42_34215 [Nocardia sp. NBC_01009]